MLSRMQVSRCCCDVPSTLYPGLYGQWTQGASGGVNYPNSTYNPTLDQLVFANPGGVTVSLSGMVLVESVPIANGATITSASLSIAKYTGTTTFAGTMNAYIDAWDVDSANGSGSSPWTNGTDVDAATRTSAATGSFLFHRFDVGDPPGGPFLVASPDLTAIVQELVNRAGWASGNNMMFFINQSGSTFDVPLPNQTLALNVYGQDAVPTQPNDTIFLFEVA